MPTSKRKPVKGKRIPHAVKKRSAHGHIAAGDWVMPFRGNDNAVIGVATGTSTTGGDGTTIRILGFSPPPPKPTPKPPALRPWLCRVLGWHDWKLNLEPMAEYVCGCGPSCRTVTRYQPIHGCTCARCGRVRTGHAACDPEDGQRWDYTETRFCARTHKAFTHG